MNKSIKLVLLASFLTISGCAGVSSAFRPLLNRRANNGDTGNFTATVSAEDTISCSTAPQGTTFNFAETYGTSTQMTSGNSQTLSVNLPDNYYLTGLTLSMHSNSKGGAGNLSINGTTIINTAPFNNAAWHGSWSQSFVDVEVNNANFNNFVAGNDINDFTIVISATANSLYCRSYKIFWGYYEDPNTYHSVSFNSLGGGNFDSQKVVEGETVSSLPTPTIAKDEENKKKYEFVGWYILSNADDPSNPTFEGATEFTTATPVNSDITIYAKYNVINYYIVSFDSLGGTPVAAQEVDEGKKVSLPTPAPTKESDENYNYEFVGWYKEEGCVNAYDFDFVVNDNFTLFAKWNQSLRPAKEGVQLLDTKSSLSYSDYQKNDQSTTDTLDREFTGVSDGAATYENWQKSGASSVAYKGNSAGSYNSIQLRSSGSESGIIVSANPNSLDAKKITVKWEEHTSSERVIQVYGKEAAYENPSDLYNNNKKGTLLVELAVEDAINNALSMDITGSYKFIGIRSKSGAQYVSSLDIQWGNISYTYTDLAVRFSGVVEQGLYERLNTESGIKGYGMLFAEYDFIKDTDADLKNWIILVDDENVKNYTNANTVHEPANKVTPTLKDGNYVWNLYKTVPLEKAKTDYVAVAYIILNNDELVFLKQVVSSVKSLAKDLIDGPDRDENSFGGSLNYLASL